MQIINLMLSSIQSNFAKVKAYVNINQHNWQNSPPQKILPDLSIPPGFRFFGRYSNFIYRARSLTLHPTPNLEDRVSVFLSPSDRVTQLYPQARGSFFFAFYDSQEELG
jgi:hypothetical protein